MPRSKEQLDRETAYLTFLPPMGEGFHTGYHTTPGIVCDRNRRPSEWLESLARCMRTPGEDVGFSIPDVLSGEQQLRRLARAGEHVCPQMADYRAVLSLLLLWDVWTKDDSWPVLELRHVRGDTPFSASVTASLTPERARDGLWIYALRAPNAPEDDAHPIALISRAMAITPAADMGDLSALLPPCVTWYDRVTNSFLDPCQSLNERDGAYLRFRLQQLIALYEQPALRSPLAKADAALCSTLRRFSEDILAARNDARERFDRGDAAAEREWLTRVLAAYTLHDGANVPVTHEVIDLGKADPRQNPLLQVYLNETLPAIEPPPFTLHALDGVAFACPSAEYLLSPMRAAGENEVMARLERELALLETHAPLWREHAAETLRDLARQAAGKAGMHPRICELLLRRARELEALPAPAGREIELTYPLTECPAALTSLLSDMLGSCDGTLIRNVFSDCLLLMEKAPVPSETAFPVEGMGCFAIPPLSPQFAAWLMEREEIDDLYAPKLEMESLHLLREGNSVIAAFRVLCRVKDEGAARTDAVTFRRVYTLSDRMQSGAAALVSDAPYVAVWPNVRLTPGLWKQYFVYTHRPRFLDVWALGQEGWVQGKLHENNGRTWQTACVSRFPAFVALKRGALSLGVLVNDLPRRLTRHEVPADIAIDFGSISTTVMLGQGERIQPATLPECMHKTLLCLDPADGAHLANEFIPQGVLLPAAPIEATYYSVMDMFSDDPDRWVGILQDGHIYYHETFGELIQKSANALYYDLKWGEDDHARRCLKLFLKQAMVQAALSARLWGSPSVAWRVSMPNAMPPHRQEAYLEMMRGLAREVAAETGLPLTSGVPAVLYASENQADGLYFLSRSEINFQNGYLNLDIGGSTADVSLWLGGASHAAIESSLLMGCRQMLFSSLSAWHAADLVKDVSLGSDALKAAASRVAEAFQTECATVQGQRKCMFLLDDLLSAYAAELRRAMAAARTDGRIGYLESLLLFELGYLLFLCGELLQRAYRDEELGALLPERMELCVAGNGGQLFKLFTDEQLTRLCSLALSRLSQGHPLRVLLPIQSRHPKQEVARGLLSDRGVLQSAIGGMDRWNGTPAFDAIAQRENPLRSYLPLFHRVFPQAAERLMPCLISESGDAFGPTAAMELDTIFANERTLTPQDDMATYVRCFEKLKQLWRI